MKTLWIILRELALLGFIISTTFGTVIYLTFLVFVNTFECALKQCDKSEAVSTYYIVGVAKFWERFEYYVESTNEEFKDYCKRGDNWKQRK